MDLYGENSKWFQTHIVMSYFLAWKEHYKPKDNFLTLGLDFCVLTIAILEELLGRRRQGGPPAASSCFRLHG